MPTQCNAEQLEFSCVERRRVVAAFDGGRVSSDSGALLLQRTDQAIGLIDRLARCFVDRRDPSLIEHSMRTLIGQRVFGMALGYEDLNDHEQLRHDPVFGALLGKLTARRARCAALAGKSTLNRLELHPAAGVDRYHKIVPQGEAIERLWSELFLDAHREVPEEIVLDLDATDDPLHGHQEGRFFHGYYDGYCYLPLYIFCGEHLLCAKLRRSNIDGAAGAREEVERIVEQIRARWPTVKIILRADSGFCREELMNWCEQNAVDYVFGLAKNPRLVRSIGAELQVAAAESRATQRPARRFKELVYRTRKSWRCARRVVAKAEHTGDKANPRFIVTSRRCSAGPRVSCTRISTARAGSARTASRKRSSIYLPIDSRRQPSGPINCACGWPRPLTCRCTRCGASGCPAPGSLGPVPTRSGCGY